MSAQYIYVARYDLAVGHKLVLLFKMGDCFIPIPSCSNNPNWAVCVDMKGNIGYVPYTYVDNKQVSDDEFLWFIDDALEKIHADSPSSISKLTRDVISDLTRRRAELREIISQQKTSPKDHLEKPRPEFVNHDTTDKALSPEITTQNDKVSTADENLQKTDFPVDDSVNTPTENNEAFINTAIENEAADNTPIEDNESSENIPNKNDDIDDDPSSKICDSVQNTPKPEDVLDSHIESSTQTENILNSTVPNWLVPSLIENIRRHTQLSFQNSKTAISVIINTIGDALPHLSPVWCQLKEHLDKLEVIQENPEVVVQSEDKRKLFDIFEQLWNCKNDEQQRSWPVHEDEDHIGTLLSDMNTILMDANPRVTREVIQCDCYEMVNTLITYYQMEPRRTLRVKVLHVFLTLCQLDLTVVTCLLNSVLPTELARDIQDNFEDEEKVQYSCYLLTVIFSTGEQPPRGTYDFINKKFLHFLLEKLEDVIKEGEDDMGQNLLNIILAFNLHFHEGQDNLVLETLKERNTAQALTERLVFLLNREEDPTRVLPHDIDVPNSVLKFMVDLFSNSALIELFYLNDIKVLLDIVVRQLSDLLPGEKTTEALQKVPSSISYSVLKCVGVARSHIIERRFPLRDQFSGIGTVFTKRKKRLEYMMLVRNLLRNSNYGEHMHQADGLRKCFQTALTLEDPEENEVEIILNIMNEFADWFSEK